MKQPFRRVLVGAAFLLLVGSMARTRRMRQRKHSLESDYGFMIGHWTCHVTRAGPGRSGRQRGVWWSFDKHVLRESMRVGPKLVGEFLTTYEQATDRFKESASVPGVMWYGKMPASIQDISAKEVLRLTPGK